MSEDKASRIEYIDVFRAIGIILMIMGHVGFGHTFDFFIHSFHMPMFFIISGYFFKSKSREELPLKKLVVKKAKALLLPYIIFGISHYIVSILINVITNQTVKIDSLLHLFSVNTTNLPICGALWFLTALFFTDIIFFLFERYIKNKVVLTIVIFVIAIFANYANLILPISLPLALNQSFVGLGLYYIGYLLKRNEKNKIVCCLMNLPWWGGILLAGITAGLIFMNGYVNMRTGSYSIVPLFWINAVLFTIAILNFARLVYPHIENNCAGRWLRGIGKDSIVYLCLNQIVILFLRIGINYLIPSTNILIKIFEFIATMFVLYFLNQVIVKTKLKAIIGRR